MIRKITVSLLVLLAFGSFRSDSLPTEFSELLDRAQMSFETPEGMVYTKPIPNPQMNYEYAVKMPKKKFEVRYAIRPLDTYVKEYEEFLRNKKDGDIMVEPNKLHSALMQATVMNISGGQLPEISEFDSKAVKKEFNADWGAVAFVQAGKEFGQKYKYCLVVALHKDNIGNAYYFYLSDRNDNISELMIPAFHSLKFKE